MGLRMQIVVGVDEYNRSNLLGLCATQTSASEMGLSTTSTRITVPSAMGIAFFPPAAYEVSAIRRDYTRLLRFFHIRWNSEMDDIVRIIG